jgi:hypothetical protein
MSLIVPSVYATNRSSRLSLLKSAGNTLKIVFCGSVASVIHRLLSKDVHDTIVLSLGLTNTGSPRLMEKADPNALVDSPTDDPAARDVRCLLPPLNHTKACVSLASSRLGVFFVFSKLDV